jgi:glycosyltransferase involved in cell wall biosynthesis
MGGDHGDGVELSILVPVYNEAESLQPLRAEISAAVAGIEGIRGYEIVFVDDGSTDGTSEILDAFADEDPRVTVIHFRRNFGKSPALAAGFAQVRGEIVITLDADLQDDPAMIPEFVERIRGGADLVSGWKKRRNDPIDKTLPSLVFNWVLSRASGVKLRDFNCGFKAYRAACVHELRVYGGFHRFLPVFAHDRGFRVEELVVQHRARKFGQSKFGARRFFEGLLDLPTVLLVTRYRTRPLHFFGIPGALLLLAGVGLLTYLSVLWTLGQPVGTRPLLTLGALLTITGFQVLCVGLVAEVIVRTTLGSGDVFAIKSVRRRGQPTQEQPNAKRARQSTEARE